MEKKTVIIAKQMGEELINSPKIGGVNYESSHAKLSSPALNLQGELYMIVIVRII